MKKIALITGATNGIGYFTALELAKNGFHIILIGRNKDKTKKISDEIKYKSNNSFVDYYIADLSSFSQTKNLANDINLKYEKLDLLINNAGAIFPDFNLTEDGIEETFALNHFSYFIMTGILLDKLKSTENSRIISVSSEAHRVKNFNLDAIYGKLPYKSFKYYSYSKLANLLFTFKLAEKLNNTSVTANALHPGIVKTGFGNDFKGIFKAFLKASSIFFITPEKGAETTLHLALSQEVSKVNGKYFKNKKIANSSKLSQDKSLASQLWSLSEQITGIVY